jgi:hypothetical protein
MRASGECTSGYPRKALSPVVWGQRKVRAVKGLIFATLAASLLGSVSALAQSESIRPVSAEQSTISKIAGKKFTAADGSSLTFFAYQGGLAREIHTATGATIIETYALKNSGAGTVSDSESSSGPAGTFRITAAGLTANYNDGHSETLAANGSGGMRMTTHGASGDLMCTAFYPEGHRFSDAERQAALIDVSALPQTSARNSCEPVVTREARTKVDRHSAQSDETVVARLPE